ncbi:MAG: hypothetical protein Ct9H300mP32_5420 [Verrucomicrobiota bacterium]|nr:MAG: hypothetical protein Ct9H300mP32_5420 [Verrucomicrobiota bacterium]
MALAKACVGEWFTQNRLITRSGNLSATEWLCAASGFGVSTARRKAILNCLSKAFAGMTLAKQAIAADVKPAFRKHMPREQWEWLDEFAPQTIAWPNDKPKQLQYPDEPADKHGNPLPGGVAREAARLLPLGRAPRICDGEQIVPVKLLTPKKKGKSISVRLADIQATRISENPKRPPGQIPGVGWV